MKIKFVLSKKNWTTFHNYYWTQALKEQFDFVFIEDNPSISPQDSLLVSNLTTDRWYQDLYDSGYRLVLDLCWGSQPINQERTFLLEPVDFFWYNDAMLYKSRGYDNYRPNKNYQHTALVPMANRRAWRDDFYNKLKPYLNDMMWSYIDLLGKHLPGDNSTQKDPHLFIPDWYDTTYFSAISETDIRPEGILMSEKTFKPMAFYHPFVTYGRTGLLAHLHHLGFETFPELFDESYDLTDDNNKRLNLVVANIVNFKKEPYSQITLDKLEHNHNLFYNQDSINHKINIDIVEPVLNFANVV